MTSRSARRVVSTLAASYPSLVLGTSLALSQLGCAATEPLPPAPTEVLVVVNKTARTLTVVPTGAPNDTATIPLGATHPTPEGIDARGGIALVPLGADNAVAVVDLGTRTILHTWPLPANSGATGAAIVDDSIGYVGDPGIDAVTRINYLTGASATISVGVHPQAIKYTRGKLFVLNANVDSTLTPLGASWITVVDPVTNAVATGIDSIPLFGPGFARSASLGSDGLLYVMNAGDSTAGEGRLSIINPVGRTEIGSFGGFGQLPAGIANGPDRLYVASRSYGMMVFDTRARAVLRGAGEAVGVAENTAVAVDAEGRVYAIRSGPCTGGAAGRAFIFRPTDLANTGFIPLGECSSDAIITTVPVAP